MKPYQGVLAFIGYFVLQIIVSARISMDYCEVISGIIALIAFGWLAAQKEDAAYEQPGLEGFSAPLLSGNWPWPGSGFQNSDCSWSFERSANP